MVVEEREVHLFSFPHPIQHQQAIATPCNPRGLLEVSSAPDRCILFYPGPSTDKFTGTVRVHVSEEGDEPRVGCSFRSAVLCATCLGCLSRSGGQLLHHPSTPARYRLHCHQHHRLPPGHRFRQGAVVPDDPCMAGWGCKPPVCVQGTLIRVRDVIKNEALAEFRRGADSAVINWWAGKVLKNALICLATISSSPFPLLVSRSAPTPASCVPPATKEQFTYLLCTIKN